ncbi:alanine racemase [Roseivirga sp. E12]|uniref:alanine racemase n=1 Tax=Roseivirga sp. E12 TaxID=2819237 RepID=UPI001ABCBBCE|nr:alanine racemase [Roseivirga sp. E12]MBO3698433.1 alanine racemase [Roseivirga sp. E12]
MIENITRPTLLLDLKKMESNIDSMIEKADRLNVKLVPHFKTHQSKEVAQYFRKKGLRSITVSSVLMAEYFVKHGWQDITVAFPFNRLEVGVINGFISQGVNVKLLITDVDTVSFLGKELVGAVDLFIELDAGYHRSGVNTNHIDEIRAIASEMAKSDNTKFYGLYCHPGNTYHEDSIDRIKSLWRDAIEKVNEVRLNLTDLGKDVVIRMGDTPGCAVVEDMKGVDEIGPGNFVFYDLVMNYLNVCDESNIAVAVACPIVAKNDERKEIVIHGGAVHFSKDHLFDESEQKFFGEMVILQEDGWSNIVPGAKLVSISQEHGILSVSDRLFDTLKVGDVIGILPIHSCLTANLMNEYVTLSGQKFEHM